MKRVGVGVAAFFLTTAGWAFDFGQSVSPVVPSFVASLQPDPGAQNLKAELETLKAKLAEQEGEEQYLEEASKLGVVAAVQKSKLPPRQQKRLAVAIVREARKNNLDPLLVVALNRTESGFDNYAVSGVGAMGLMQVMPDTGKWLAERRGEQLGRASNLFDSETNVELGTWYLSELINQFGTVEKALVAYNAGPGLAKKILAKPANRKKFMAGYPAKVVGEHKKLRAQYERETAQRSTLAAADKAG